LGRRGRAREKLFKMDGGRTVIERDEKVRGKKRKASGGEGYPRTISFLKEGNNRRKVFSKKSLLLTGYRRSLDGGPERRSATRRR